MPLNYFISQYIPLRSKISREVSDSNKNIAAQFVIEEEYVHADTTLSHIFIASLQVHRSTIH